MDKPQSDRIKAIRGGYDEIAGWAMTLTHAVFLLTLTLSALTYLIAIKEMAALQLLTMKNAMIVTSDSTLSQLRSILHPLYLWFFISLYIFFYYMRFKLIFLFTTFENLKHTIIFIHSMTLLSLYGVSRVGKKACLLQTRIDNIVLNPNSSSGVALNPVYFLYFLLTISFIIIFVRWRYKVYMYREQREEDAIDRVINDRNSEEAKWAEKIRGLEARLSRKKR